MTEHSVLYKVKLVLGFQVYCGIHLRHPIRGLHVKKSYSDTKAMFPTRLSPLGI